MIEFNTRVTKDDYRIELHTDIEVLYKCIQDTIRFAIDMMDTEDKEQDNDININN